jgi:hypothetical protein
LNRLRNREGITDRLTRIVRYAGMFAAVSWYLVIPPYPTDDYEEVAPQAPLSSWIEIDRYTTLRQCKSGIKMSLDDDENGDTAKMMVDFGFFRCIASNDPRLKGS